MVSFAIPHDHQQWVQHGTDRIQMADSPAMRAVTAYLERKPLHWIIVLAAKHRGSGKSLAAAWLLTKLEELAADDSDEDVSAARHRAWGHPSLWCDCEGLRQLKGDAEWDRESAYAKLTNAWVLVLDDVGTEKDASVVQSILTMRRANGLLTICTTNLVHHDDDQARDHRLVAGQPMAEWKERLDARITSRMRSSADDEGLAAWCYVPGPDMRGRVDPVVLPDAARTLVDVDIDAIAGPLLRSVKQPAKAPVYEREIVADRLLEHVTAKAMVGERWAIDALEAARRPPMKVLSNLRKGGAG